MHSDCLVNDSAVPKTELDPTLMAVCTFGNYNAQAECSTVESISPSQDYISQDSYVFDWGVIELDDNLGAGNYMALSQTNSSTIESSTIYTAGYPGVLPVYSDPICRWNQRLVSGTAWQEYGPLPDQTGTTGYDNAAYRYTQSGDIYNSTWRAVKGRFDRTGGESGAGYWYYPGGCCGSHVLVAVHSGLMKASNFQNSFHGGPKVPYFRDEILCAMGC